MLPIDPLRVNFLLKRLKFDCSAVPETVLTRAIIRAEYELDHTQTLEAYSNRVREIVQERIDSGCLVHEEDDTDTALRLELAS